MFTIGSRNEKSGGLYREPWKGYIDEVVILKRSLELGALAQIYLDPDYY